MTWRTKCWKSLSQNTSIHSIGIPEGEEREKGPGKISEEITAEYIHNMGKDIVNQAQKVQRDPGRINPRRNTLRHIVMKVTKIKDRDKVLKATKENDNI